MQGPRYRYNFRDSDGKRAGDVAPPRFGIVMGETLTGGRPSRSMRPPAIAAGSSMTMPCSRRRARSRPVGARRCGHYWTAMVTAAHPASQSNDEDALRL